MKRELFDNFTKSLAFLKTKCWMIGNVTEGFVVFLETEQYFFFSRAYWKVIVVVLNIAPL